MTAHRVGITGGIGSGKSTVARLLATQGATVIDADAISRAVTAPGGAAIAALSEAFGSGILTPEGALDREQMRVLAFGDPRAKSRLESIIHPLVERSIGHTALEAEQNGAHCLVFDIPLLVESPHWRRYLHRILVVDCREETQVGRVVARNALGVADIQKIMASQASRTDRLAAADWVLFNDGISLDQLAHSTHEIGRQFGL